MNGNKLSTTLDVSGMSCPSCIRHINAALRDLEGVEDVEVKLADGRVVVQHTADAKTEAMVAALEEAGYESQLAA